MSVSSVQFIDDFHGRLRVLGTGHFNTDPCLFSFSAMAWLCFAARCNGFALAICGGNGTDGATLHGRPVAALLALFWVVGGGGMDGSRTSRRRPFFIAHVGKRFDGHATDC